MKSNFFPSFILVICILCANLSYARSYDQLTDDDIQYLAEMQMLTRTGRGYFAMATKEHFVNWKGVMEYCSGLDMHQEFTFPVTVTIRPSGDVGHVSINPMGQKLEGKLNDFVNCMGKTLMACTYPKHPFPIFYFKFKATDSIEKLLKESSVEKKSIKKQLIGIWKSEKNGSYIKINDFGKAYYCLYKNPALKVVAMGDIDDDYNLKWGKFFLLKRAEIFDINEDLKSDMGNHWSYAIDGKVLNTFDKDKLESTYLKTDQMDITCD